MAAVPLPSGSMRGGEMWKGVKTGCAFSESAVPQTLATRLHSSDGISSVHQPRSQARCFQLLEAETERRPSRDSGGSGAAACLNRFRGFLELRTLFVYTEFTKKKVFGQLTLAGASPARFRHGRHKVSIPECDLKGRRSTITLLPVRSHSGIDTFCLPWRRHAGDPAPTVSHSKSFFLVNSAYTNNVLSAGVDV